MNTMKTSMQIALEALGEIRECAEMIEPIFPRLTLKLNTIEAQIHTMGCELKVRESYPIDAVSETGAKIQRVVEDFENIIHEKCQDIWALVGSVEREKWSPADLSVALGELLWPEKILGSVMECHFGRGTIVVAALATKVRDEASDYHRRKYEEEEAANVQRQPTE